MTAGKNLALAMAVVGVAIIVLGMLSMDTGTMLNAIVIAFLLMFVQFFFHKYSRFAWVKAVESQFPNFLRDVADLIRSGMSFPDAVRSVSKSNYGKLTDSVRAMSNRLSWGTPFQRVLDIFGGNVKESKIITEVLHIIKESYRSGGNISMTLDSVASNIVMLKDSEAEKRSLVQEQVGIIYGIFFMFVAITIIIVYVLVPMIGTNIGGSMAGAESFGAASMSSLSLTFSNPCEVSYVFPCPVYSGIGMMLGLKEGIGGYYIALFFLTIIIEGLFLGLVVGQLSSNSLSAGIKDSVIMILIGISIFIFLSKAGFFPM